MKIRSELSILDNSLSLSFHHKMVHKYGISHLVWMRVQQSFWKSEEIAQDFFEIDKLSQKYEKFILLNSNSSYSFVNRFRLQLVWKTLNSRQSRIQRGLNDGCGCVCVRACAMLILLMCGRQFNGGKQISKMLDVLI